jgi:DNA-binding GntR family transcriptional regulator
MKQGSSPYPGDGQNASKSKRRGYGLREVTRETLADSVYAELRSAIIRGELRDGTEVKQAEVAEQLGVSRVPVREAMRRLQAEHLVQGNPFQRLVVTSLTADEVMELVDLREELEVFSLKRAIHSESLPARLRQARKAATAMRVDQDPESWLEADREFHRLLNGNTTAVATVIEDVRERVHRYLHSAVASTERRDEILKEHENLVACLEAGDEAALEKVIRRHVRGTRGVLEHAFVVAGPGEGDGRPSPDEPDRGGSKSAPEPT